MVVCSFRELGVYQTLARSSPPSFLRLALRAGHHALRGGEDGDAEAVDMTRGISPAPT